MGRFGKTFASFAGAAVSCAIVTLCPAVAFAQTSNSPLNASATPAPAPNAAPLAASLAPAPPSTPNWTGLYVGGLFGGGWGKATATSTTVFSSTGYFATSSVTTVNASGVHNLAASKPPFGGELGFNGQAGGAVFGAEGDFNVMRLSDSKSTTAIYPCCAPTTFTLTQSVKTTWLMTLRGRAGATVGQVLVYGTAGLAWTNLDYEEVFTDNYAPTTESGTINDKQKAFIYGGGAEFHGGAHWSIKGEYLHSDFGTFTTTSTNLRAYTPPIDFPTSVFTHSTTFKLDLFRVGFNVGF